MRMTDVANTEQLLRIIQSIPSPKAEPLKLWLAQTGADHLVDLADAQKLQAEIDLRLQARSDVREHNKSLAKAAQDAGVETSEEFARFQNSGYMGLYNGETAAAIKRRKGLKSRRIFWTIWEARNWRQICSESRRRRQNWPARVFMINRRRTGRISR